MASYAAATICTFVGTSTGSSPSLSTVIDANHPYYVHNSDNPIQVRGKEGEKEQSRKTFTTVSRRALTQLAVASLAATTASFPEPAEARILNPEIKRKIFEKLKMLREKVGLSKRDTENEEKTSSAAAGEKEKPLPQLPLSPLPVQAAEAL